MKLLLVLTAVLFIFPLSQVFADQTVSGTIYEIETTLEQGSHCDSIAISKTVSGTVLQIPYVQDESDGCKVLALYFDLSFLEGDFTSANLTFDVTGATDGNAECQITPMTTDPTTDTAQEVYDDILDGTAIITDDTNCSDSGSVTINLDSELSIINSLIGTDYSLGLSHESQLRLPLNDNVMYWHDNDDSDWGYFWTTNSTDITTIPDIEFNTAYTDSTNGELLFIVNGTYPTDMKMYHTSSSTENVHQYSCADGIEDLSTCSFDGSFDVSTETTSIGSMAFDDDGDQLFVCGTGSAPSDGISVYDVTSPFDITGTVVWSHDYNVGDCSDLHWLDGGTSLQYMDPTLDTITQRTCSTPYDTSSCGGATLIDLNNITTEASDSRFFDYNEDGSIMIQWASGGDGDLLYWIADTNYDATTLTYNSTLAMNQIEDYGTNFAGGGGWFYGDDYQYFCLIVGQAGFGVSCIPTLEPYDTRYMLGQGVSFGSSADDIWIAPDGLHVAVFMDTNPADLRIYTIDEPYNFRFNQGFTETIGYAYPEWNLQGGFGHPDGYKVWSGDNTGTETIYEMTMTQQWDASTASVSDTYNVGQDTSLKDVFWRTDDYTSLYTVGDSTNTIYQHDCTESADLSTCTYASKSLGVGGCDGTPMSANFNSDGTLLRVTGNDNDRMCQYTCSSAWEINTCGSLVTKSLSKSIVTTSTAFHWVTGSAQQYSEISNMELLLGETQPAICEDISSNQLVLNWEEDQFGEDLQGYGIQTSLDDVIFTNQIENTFSTDSEHLITGLDSSTLYYLQWRNQFFNGTSGDWSDSTQCTTLQGGGGGSPTPDPVCTIQQLLDPNHECFEPIDECTPITSFEIIGGNTNNVNIGQTSHNELGALWSGNDNLRIDEIVPDETTGIKLAFQQPIEFPPGIAGVTTSNIPYTIQNPATECIDEQTPNCIYQNAEYEIPIKIFGSSCQEDFRVDSTIIVTIRDDQPFDFRLLLLAIIGMFLIFFIIAKRKKKKKQKWRSKLS